MCLQNWEMFNPEPNRNSSLIKLFLNKHFPDSRAAVFLYKMLQMQAILNGGKLEQEISKQVCWYEKISQAVFTAKVQCCMCRLQV